ncbi:MAG TPA: aminotransferase class IV [Kribbella sp.]|nr:aminotransferase class IV [Kribbella sp.]
MSYLRVADSFLVAEGKVRGLDLHRDRFTSSCTALGVSAGEFWDASVRQLPRTGRWFPRFELGASGEPALLIRPAPPTGGGVRVSVHDGPDPRTAPRVKGPDLAALGELKARAASAYGADEVLLTAPDGAVLEAAYSGVLWWEGEALCEPPGDRPILPSVTARLVRRIAAEAGVEVVERARTAAELADLEVWLVNALHGIRQVEAWQTAPPRAVDARRAGQWQQALLDLAEPLPPVD